MSHVPPKPRSFITTKEHRRFVEFASAVRKQRTIGLCYGPAGIGKTISALRVSNWNRIGPYLRDWKPFGPYDQKIASACARSGTVFYTARVGAGWRQVRDELGVDLFRFGHLIATDVARRNDAMVRDTAAASVELLLIDEAERLNAMCLEWVRDEFDRRDMGLILTGMPGIEKRMSRYPQLYSRVGFAHEYRPLQRDELVFVLEHHWRKLGLDLDETEFTDAQAIAAIARITGGNFRLLQRLFAQIERVLKINELTAITDDVVEAARSTLVIGAN
jgi:DNA transposition AAA+ family ATPase